MKKEEEKEKITLCESIGHLPLRGCCPKRRRGERENQSPKGNMWSAIPIALLCMIVDWSERKQGSGPEGDKVL